jgi:hypothetical protein
MRLIRDMYNDLDSFGRFWFAIGLAALVAAAAMSADFGWQVSTKHAIFLAVLTVVAAFGPMAAEMLFSKGRKGPALAVAALCVPLLLIEFYSHAGYTAGLRGTNIETATVQNAKWTGAQDAVSEDKQNVALWKQQLSALLEQNAWAGTVKADGLRSELKTLESRVEEEKKGKRGRKAGCGAECERLQNAANALRARIATIEQADDLTRRIEATQRVLDNKRGVAATTEHKSSAVDHQNKFLVANVALFANGSTEASPLQALGAEQSVNLGMALAGTGLPAFALFLAGLFRSERRRDEWPRPSASAPVAAPPRPMAPAPAAPVGMSLATLVPQGARDKVLDVMTFADLKRLAAS